MKIKPAILFLGIVILTIDMSGCGSRKKTLASNVVLTTLGENASQKMQDNSFDWTHISLRAKTNYKDQYVQQNLTINLKMVKDSIIWASVTAFNIEVARALITVDSFKMIDRINRRYYVGGIDLMKRYIKQSFTLSQLQNLFIGNSFQDGTGYTKSNSDLLNDHLAYSDSAFQNTVRLTEGHRIRYSTMQNAENTQKADVDYDVFQRFKKRGSLPTKLGIELSGDKIQDISLSITYASVSVDPFDAVSFSIPSKYAKGN